MRLNNRAYCSIFLEVQHVFSATVHLATVVVSGLGAYSSSILSDDPAQVDLGSPDLSGRKSDLPRFSAGLRPDHPDFHQYLARCRSSHSDLRGFAYLLFGGIPQEITTRAWQL